MDESPIYEQIAHRRSEFLARVLKEAGTRGIGSWYFQDPPLFDPNSTLPFLRFYFPKRQHESKDGIPSMEDPKNECLGLELMVLAEGAGRGWKVPPWSLSVNFGYALGAAQKFTRIGNPVLAGIFIKLADLEEQAWETLKPTKWKAGKPFRPNDLLTQAGRVLRHITDCSVLAGNAPDDFALHLSLAYEAAHKLESDPMKGARNGKRRLPAAEQIIERLRAFPDGEREHAFAALEAERCLRTVSDSNRFKIRDSGKTWSKKTWANSTFNTWWTLSREPKKQ
jgi:hypothetical protein